MKLNKMPITKNNELYERYLHGKLIPVGFLERDFFLAKLGAVKV